MMNLLQIIKLAKTIQKFAEIETANGILIVNGDLAEGVEVFVEQDGEVVPALDGEYETEDKIIVIADGKVSELKDKEEAKPEEEKPAEEAPVNEEQEEEKPADEEKPAEEEKPADDEKDAKIAELEAKIAELEAENAELKNKLGEAEEQLSKPVKTDTKLEKQNKIFKNYLK